MLCDIDANQKPSGAPFTFKVENFYICSYSRTLVHTQHKKTKHFQKPISSWESINRIRNRGKTDILVGAKRCGCSDNERNVTCVWYITRNTKLVYIYVLQLEWETDIILRIYTNMKKPIYTSFFFVHWTHILTIFTGWFCFGRIWWNFDESFGWKMELVFVRWILFGFFALNIWIIWEFNFICLERIWWKLRLERCCGTVAHFHVYPRTKLCGEQPNKNITQTFTLVSYWLCYHW